MYKNFILFIVFSSFLFSQDCNEAKILYESNQFEEASKSVNSESSECSYLGFQISVSLDDLNKAKEYISQAITQDESNQNYKDSAKNLETTIRAITSANYSLENSSIDDAILEYQTKIEDSSLLKTSLFHKGLGIAYKRKFYSLESTLDINSENYFEYIDLSIKYFNEANSINPYANYEDEILNITKKLTKDAKVQMKQEEYNFALKLLNKAVEYYSDYNMAHFTKGELYRKLQDYQLAISSYLSGLGSNVKSGNYKILYLAGLCYERMGDFEKAKEFYGYSFSKKQSYTKAQFGLANILYNEQNHIESEDNLFSIIDKDPTFIKAYELLVNIYSDTEDYSKAKQYADIGIEMDSKAYSLYAKRARIYNKLENYNAAISDAEQSLKIKKRYGPAYIELGTANAFLCNKVAAEEAFTKSKKYNRRLASESLEWLKSHIKEACN